MAVSIEGDLATSHRIAASLREEILSGQFAPGTRIRQEDIAEQFGASRSPVREALRMLDADGLVTLIANTGAWIAQLSLTECEEMYLIRERLEPLLLKTSMPYLTEESLVRLAILALEMEANQDVETFLRLDREFHLLSYSGASTALLGEMVQRLWNTTEHYRRAYTRLLASNGFKTAHYEHYLLLAAITRDDAEDAERILYGHIRRTRLELANHPEVFA